MHTTDHLRWKFCSQQCTRFRHGSSVPLTIFWLDQGARDSEFACGSDGVCIFGADCPRFWRRCSDPFLLCRHFCSPLKNRTVPCPKCDGVIVDTDGEGHNRSSLPCPAMSAHTVSATMLGSPAVQSVALTMDCPNGVSARAASAGPPKRRNAMI